MQLESSIGLFRISVGAQLRVPSGGSFCQQDCQGLQLRGAGVQDPFRIYICADGISTTGTLDPQDCYQTMVVRGLELNIGSFQDLLGYGWQCFPLCPWQTVGRLYLRKGSVEYRIFSGFPGSQTGVSSAKTPCQQDSSQTVTGKDWDSVIGTFQKYVHMFTKKTSKTMVITELF